SAAQHAAILNINCLNRGTHAPIQLIKPAPPLPACFSPRCRLDLAPIPALPGPMGSIAAAFAHHALKTPLLGYLQPRQRRPRRVQIARRPGSRNAPVRSQERLALRQRLQTKVGRPSPSLAMTSPSSTAVLAD